MSKNTKRPPLYRTLTDRHGQFIVNVAPLPTGIVEVYRPGDAGELHPVANISIPDHLKKSDLDPYEFRLHIFKEMRKIESYLTAKKEFESSKSTIIDESQVQPKEDLRRTPTTGAKRDARSIEARPTAKKAKEKKRSAGRPSMFKDIDWES